MKRVLVFLVTTALWFSAFAPVPIKGQDQGLRERNPEPQVEPDSKPQVKFRKVEKRIPNRYIVVLNDESLGINDPVSRFSDDLTDQRYDLAKQIDEITAQKVEAKAFELARAHRGIISHVYKHALRGFSAEMTEDEAMALSENPEVEYVQEDRLIHAAQTNATWGLDRIDQRDLPLNNTYTFNDTGAGVNVYVIDTGIQTSHDEFEGRATVFYDAIDDDNNPNTPTNTDRGGGFLDGIDCHGHGTHVAGTIGGTTFGVAKDVRLHAVRVLGRNANDLLGCGPAFRSGRETEVIAGIDWVRAVHVKPAVANMSFGGGVSDPVDRAVRNCIAAGVTCVVAAGNSNMDASNFSPARVTEAITVGATDNTDTRGTLSNSNWGPVLDIFAPGDNILSAGIASDTATSVRSGTSMAAPHVAGVAALHLQDNPQASPATVRLAIVMNATKDKVTDPVTGSPLHTASPNRLLYSFVNNQLFTSDPAAVSWGSGRIDLFVRGADNALWHRFYYDNRFWSDWYSLGGNLASGPAVCSWEPGRLDIFARGTDNALWHKFQYDNRVWSDWYSLGGTFISDPAAVSWGWGRIDIFVRGTDNALWHKFYYDNRVWSSWYSLGGNLTSSPAVCSWEPGRLDVFARGADYKLWHKFYYDNRVWSSWYSLGGANIYSAPDAVSWGWGRIDVFARGLGNDLWHKFYYDNRIWSDWYSLGSFLTSGPGVSSWAPGRLDIFARGTNSGLLHRYYYDNRYWGGWYYL